MFLIRLFRYLRGYVQFRAEGVFVERFLNLVARDSIPVWNGRKQSGVYTGYTNASSYRRLRRHAKKTGVSLRVQDKIGVPFTRRRYRKRTGLLVGLLVFFGFLYAMSLFIWRIEITGLESVSEQRVLEALENVGVRPGAFRPAIDVRDAERRALLALHELSWIALNIDGSAIDVQVNEAVQKPEIVDPDKPCNIVATRSGQIVSMNIYEGQALVQVGDAILEGDVIVSGITEDRRGQNMFKHARAQVMARMEHGIAVDVPLIQTRYVETGKTVCRRYLSLFSLDLPLFWPSKMEFPYHVDRSEEPLQAFGVTLPLGIFRENYHLMEEVTVILTEEEAKQQAAKELAILQKAQLGDAEIVQKEAVGALRDDAFHLECTIICILDVTEEKEIFQTENSGKHESSTDTAVSDANF